MAFDGLVTKCICSELSCLINGKINKIFEPNKNEILLGVYSGGKNYALNICIDISNYRMNLTTHSKANPQNVLGFCMVLRKHLTNGIIRKIYTNGLERVVFIDVDCRNELNDIICKTLVVELMGKHSNVILLDQNRLVIDSMRHLNKFDNSIRDVFPSSKYISILSNKLDFCSVKTFDEFYRALEVDACDAFSISSRISKVFNGFGKNNLSYLLKYLDILDSSKSSQDLKLIFTYLTKIINSPECATLQGAYIEDNCIIDSSLSISHYLEKQKKLKGKFDYFVAVSSNDIEPLSANFFADDFYYTKECSEVFNFYKNTVLKLVLNQVSKLKDKIENVNSKIRECAKMDTYKLYGELITANLYRIKDYAQSFIVVENYYDENKPITIPLDDSISPSKNASNFFKKYKKLQNTASIVNKQKELYQNELKYLDSVVYEIDSANDVSEIDGIYSEICDNFLHSAKISNTVSNSLYGTTYKSSANKKQNKSLNNVQPAKYVIDGFTVLVGKNNKQNDYLTCKLAQNSDIWFHTKDIHGSHVVLQLSGSSSKFDISNCGVPDAVLYKCASIAAYFSKAKFSQNVPVDYSYIKYVKKPNGAKLGMVIYTNNKTLYVNPDSCFKYLQK